MDAPDGASVPEPYLDPMLWRQLRGVLQFLQSNKYPHVPNPPPCKKRASVALIVRFRPLTPDSVMYDSNLCGATAATSEQRLENFFSQQWVQQGEPEILFIKRATRTGDRWTGQIAFPGGGREPNDGADCATGVRETREEIGLDLNADHCMLVGNLPEQVVTTWWSKVPLMVLCPYVHLVMRSDTHPLKLQSTEVSSTHWVSLRALMSPHLRTFERTDVSDRFLRRANRVTGSVLRAMIGQLLFTARRLVPTESVYSRSTLDYASSVHAVELQQAGSRCNMVSTWWRGSPSVTSTREPPLILWGLTYGILANFLGLLPTDNPTKMWDWPTLSPWDIRFVIWLTTYKFRAHKMRVLSTSMTALGDPIERHENVVLGGLDSDTFATTTTNVRQRSRLSSLDTVGEMLDGYFERLKTAMWIALALRLGFGTIVITILIHRYRRRRYMARL